MQISRDEADKALQEIGQAAERVSELRSYRKAAPYLLIWGAVWLVANLASVWRPAATGTIWQVFTWVGIAGSVVAGAIAHRRSATGAGQTLRQRRLWLRFLLSFCAFMLFQLTSVYLLGKLARGAYLSAHIYLLVALAYVLLGVWSGSRIAWLGVLLVVATVLGFTVLAAHGALWMGVIGGGMLLGTGLWLRRA